MVEMVNLAVRERFLHSNKGVVRGFPLTKLFYESSQVVKLYVYEFTNIQILKILLWFSGIFNYLLMNINRKYIYS